MPPPAATMRWHGTMIGIGFLPQAVPTARAEEPISSAMSP